MNTQRIMIHAGFGQKSMERDGAFACLSLKERVMSPARILVVEDEFLVASQIESILTGAGWRVIGSAGTLASAVSLARKSECDAAVLDVNLKGERVDEVAAILSERGIPFLFVSGYGRGNLPAAFRDNVEFLAKPFSEKMLVQTVGTLLRNKRKARSNRKLS